MTNDTDYFITKSVKSHHNKLHKAGPWSQKHERVCTRGSTETIASTPRTRALAPSGRVRDPRLSSSITQHRGALHPRTGEHSTEYKKEQHLSQLQ